MKHKLLLAVIQLVVFSSVYAQNVNGLLFDATNTNTRDASAAFEINANTNTPGSPVYGGLLIPRVALTGTTDAATISGTEATSLLVYNTATVSDVTPGFYYWNGSSWLRIISGNGSFPTGTGTPNYLARWITSSTLGIGATYDNGTNVGIGTSNPAQALEIYRDNADVGVRLHDPGDYHYALGIDRSDAGKFKINYGAGIGDADHFIMQTNGNVGVGTASPGGKLEVYGGPLTLSAAYLDINRDAYAQNGISWYSQGYPSWSTYMSPGTQTATGPHADLTAPQGTFVTSWALRNYIENAGGYGWTFESAANTTTPAVKFEIRSSDGLFHSYGSGVVDDRLWVTQGRYSQYTWQNAAITTPSIELVADDADNGNDPTLVFHDYGYGGPRFRKTGYDLFLEDAFGDYTYNYYINGMPVRIEQNLYAPIMYDSNDNNYYVDPNGTTQLAELGWGDSWTRTQSKADVGAIGSGKSGFYQTSAPAPASSWYPGASSWQHFLDVRHSNTGNNYSMQIAGSFFDQDFWVRKTNNNPSQAWAKMLTTANISSNAIQNQNSAQQSANFWISGTGRSDGDFRSPIFYDQNNTAYYANPNGYSNFNQLNISRDGAGECCSGGVYTLSLAESTSGTGRMAGIQFHNGGVSEGYLRLANGGARRLQLGDYQSVGMGLEMTGDFINQNVEWNQATGANYTVGANSGQHVITNSTVTLSKSSGNATNNGYSVVLLVANVTASGNDITWANGVGGYQTVQSLGHGVAGYRVYLQRSTDNANWTTLIAGSAIVGMQVGDYYMQYSGITSMVGISGDAFKFSNNVSLNYIDNVGAGTYYYRLLFETTGYNKSGGSYLISDRALSVVEIKR